MSNEKKLLAIKTSQPYGDFFLVSIPAETLLSVCYVNPATMKDSEIFGIQRAESTPRAKEIALFIDSNEAAFPNSIILSANFDSEDHLLEEENQWKFIQKDGDLYEITIPDTSVRSCSIIDGQHRLLGLKYADRHNFSFACSVYNALPPSGQASIFSTINFNQRKVDKSLAYQLFGFSLNEELRDSWTPDMLAVYFSRKFNDQLNGPFYGKIKFRLDGELPTSGWSITSAALIDGILSLFSKRPKSDRYIMNNSFSNGNEKGRSKLSPDGSPLRQYFISGNDLAIEQIIIAFFAKTEELFWRPDLLEKGTVLTSTIGIAALFQFLCAMLNRADKIDKNALDAILACMSKVDSAAFTDKSTFPHTTAGKKKILDKLLMST